MRIVHLSYSLVRPAYTDPEKWLRFSIFLSGIFESMAARHNDVIGIYHIHYKGVIHRNGVAYHFPKFNRWQLMLPFRLNQYIKKLSPDVVVVHGLISPWQVIMLRWQVGKHLKIIVQHHAEKPLRDIRQYFQKWADRYIHAYLFCAFDLGLRWVERGQIRDPRKIKEVMGTSSPFYPVEKEQARLVTKVTGDIVFLWVGGLHHRKDPLLTVRAFIRFIKTNQRVHLYMIYQSVQLLEEIRALLARAPDASDFIHLIGYVDNQDLLHWYNSADFMISSSHAEGSGIAVCESMSCGCIPILTNIPSFKMMTGNGSIGFLFDIGDEDALLDRLKKSLSLDRPAEKTNVLNLFRAELSADANARKTMLVIDEINNQR